MYPFTNVYKQNEEYTDQHIKTALMYILWRILLYKEQHHAGLCVHVWGGGGGGLMHDAKYKGG